MGCCRWLGQDDRCAIQEKPGPQREALAAAVAVLQVDDLHAPGLLNSDDSPTPAGLDIFDHKPRLGLDLTAASVLRDTPVTGKDVGAVLVVHGGIVDLALYKVECQRAVGRFRVAMGTTGMTRSRDRRWTDA